jgi:16S rRNA (guanine527-N7)-methyltransferase
MTQEQPNYFFEELEKLSLVSSETKIKLLKFKETLELWQQRINLIASGTDIWNRHFLDSAQLLTCIPDKEKTILDIGSGGGFPGLVLAILGYSKVELVESDRKKCLFLKEVSRLINTNVAIHNNRIEKVDAKKFDIISSRACASLDTLLHYSYPFVSHGTICLFPKGKNYSTEIEEARLRWYFNCKITPSITSSDGVILKITSLEYKGGGDDTKTNTHHSGSKPERRGG